MAHSPPRASGLAALMLLFALAAVPADAAITGTPTQVAHGLKTPWEVVLVPDGKTWVSERDCQVSEVGSDGSLRTIYTDPTSVTCLKFLGLVLHPNFGSNHFLYLYETYEVGGVARSRIVRLVRKGTKLAFSRVIFDGIPSNRDHDGGRMRFAPGGRLFVTTGDAGNPDAPQDLMNLNGKILRLLAPGSDLDGTAPSDNPFYGQGGNARFVFSYGHRHPQGLAFDSSGRLWETEHGPSGEPWAPAPCCRDELNLIQKGANYGWPVIAGSMTHAGMRTPVVQSGDDFTWAPGGTAFGPDGSLYATMLKGAHLRQFSCSPGWGTQAEYFAGTTRYRTVTIGRGYLWYTTDAIKTNGVRDDRLMRVPIDSTPTAC